MTHEKWITEMLAQNIRPDLDRLPSTAAVCFYGNPLRGMAMGAVDWVPQVCHVNNGVKCNLWKDLTTIATSEQVCHDLSKVATKDRSYFKLMMFWEWLRSLSSGGKTSNRWPQLQVHPTFVTLVWQGYEISMLRALKFAGETEDPPHPDLVLSLPIRREHPPHEVHPLEVASLLHRINETVPFRLFNVPTHVALMTSLKLSTKGATEKGELRGERIRQPLLEQWRLKPGSVASTPGGLRLRDGYPIGGSREAQKNRNGSPTAQLIVACGIEKFLSSRLDYKALIEKAWSDNAMTQPEPGANHDPFDSPQVTAKLLGITPEEEHTSRFAMTNSAEDTFSLIKTADPVLEDGQIQIEFPLAYQEWMGGMLSDAAVVVQTWGDIDDQRQIETIFATVLSAEDANESGDTLAVKVCALFSPTPLLDLWYQANPRKRCIDGVVTLWSVDGKPRVVLGLDVYLGELKSPPTSAH